MRQVVISSDPKGEWVIPGYLLVYGGDRIPLPLDFDVASFQANVSDAIAAGAGWVDFDTPALFYDNAKYEPKHHAILITGNIPLAILQVGQVLS